MKTEPILAVVDPKAGTVSRYVGRRCTDFVEIVSGLTPEKVEAVRVKPESFETLVPDPLEAA